METATAKHTRKTPPPMTIPQEMVYKANGEQLLPIVHACQRDGISLRVIPDMRDGAKLADITSDMRIMRYRLRLVRQAIEEASNV